VFDWIWVYIALVFYAYLYIKGVCNIWKVCSVMFEEWRLDVSWEVSTTCVSHMMIFWVFLPCNIMGLYRGFGGTFCLLLQVIELGSGQCIHLTQTLTNSPFYAVSKPGWLLFKQRLYYNVQLTWVIAKYWP
jgi:hypothetical protein